MAMHEMDLDGLLNDDMDTESLDFLDDIMSFQLPANASGNKTRRPRKRDSHELAYLRKKVVEYTQQLEELQRRKNKAAIEASPWEIVSRRQASQRYVVEQENAKLKQALEHQRDIAQKLLEIVTERPQIMEMSSIPQAHTRRLFNASMEQRRAAGNEIVRTDYARLESIMLARKVHEVKEVVQSTAIEFDETVGNVRIDSTLCEPHNIPYLRCGTALWELYNNLVPIQIKNMYFELLEEWDENTTYGRLKMKSRGIEVQSLLIQKRYIEPNRVVICTSTVVEDDKYPYQKNSSYTLHETMWLAIEKCDDNSSMLKYGSRGVVPCYENYSTPFDKKDAMIEKARVPHYTALAEFILSCYQSHFDAIKEAFDASLHSCIEQFSSPASSTIAE
ncbi:hypothetical protein THRCLA_06846 [Thraustotheca clavata]|uniref:M96 mating-specific protein family n=1 Tax=Thraustotheca clavata TaxID=74557 RepID=A0A1V9ZIJ7_9STRA|nr:hypothetical protein THRCLA_06846 [Thraustotheca clavata]